MASRIYEETLRYRRRLVARERAIVTQMLRDWRTIETDLLRRATLIGEKIEQANLAGTPVSPAWLYQQDRYEQLLEQARVQVTMLRDKYAPLILDQARLAALDGAKLAAAQLRVSTRFATLLSTNAVEFIAASTTVGPLADLLGTLEPLVGSQLRSALLLGIAEGTNPRQIARGVQKSLLLPRNRALTIARTEVARAQRQATYDSYKAAGVQTWMWLSARDATTCAACWAMDGETFDAYQEVDDHPNGRCAIVPADKDITDLADLPTKDGAWAALTAGEQRGVLGPTRYDLHTSGDLTLDAHPDTGIATTTSSPDWGTSVRVAPLAR